MNRVITNLEELEKMVEGDDKAYQIARESKNSSKLFIFLVHDMLDIFNFKNDKFEKVKEEVEIIDLLDYCVDLFRWKCMDKGIRLQKELSEEDGKEPPRVVISDGTRLQQVLVTLIRNAIKYTHKGSITIKCAYDRESQMLLLNVEDTGVGVRKNV